MVHEVSKSWTQLSAHTHTSGISVNTSLAKVSLMAKFKVDGWVIYFVYSDGRHWKVAWQMHQYKKLIINSKE